MCLYNVVVLSAVGLLFAILLEEKIIIVYAIASTCVIIGTTLTQTIIFVPKVRLNRGSYMSAQALLNLLNKLGKRDKILGLPSI